MADAQAELRHARGVEDRAAAGEGERPAGVGAVHERLDARARGVRAHVHVGEQSDDRRPWTVPGSVAMT